MEQYFWFTFFVFMNVLMVTLLALNISRLRVKERVANGDGGKLSIKKAMRAHGNGVEHVAIFGLAILALELSTVSSGILATLVIGFTLARIVHAAGMLGSAFNARRIGAAATYLFELGAVMAVLIYGVLA